MSFEPLISTVTSWARTTGGGSSPPAGQHPAPWGQSTMLPSARSISVRPQHSPPVAGAHPLRAHRHPPCRTVCRIRSDLAAKSSVVAAADRAEAADECRGPPHALTLGKVQAIPPFPVQVGASTLLHLAIRPLAFGLGRPECMETGHTELLMPGCVHSARTGAAFGARRADHGPDLLLRSACHPLLPRN